MQSNKNPILENSTLATAISLIAGAITGIPGIMLSGAEDPQRLKAAYWILFLPPALFVAALISFLVITRNKKRSGATSGKIPLRFHAQTLLSVVLGSILAIILGYAVISVLTTQVKSSIPGNVLLIAGIIGVGLSLCVGLILIGLQQRSKQALKKKLQRQYEVD